MESTLRIKRVPLDSLHQDPANARTHGNDNLEAIRASLQRFGQAEPLVVHKTGRVIGGNGRLAAMKALGWTECDVVELDIDDLALSGNSAGAHLPLRRRLRVDSTVRIMAVIRREGRSSG